MSNISPEVQAQLDEQKQNCPFCKIIKGEMKSNKVYEDDIMLGVLDINPWVKGHTLLLPKEHYPIIPFLPPETFKHMFGLVPKIVGAIKQGVVCTGFNVLIANGGVAGQQSPHFLIHLIPRDEDDGHLKYLFNDERGIDTDNAVKALDVLSKNITIMLGNHRKNNPLGSPNTKDFVNPFKEQIVYEDEFVLVLSPITPQCVGHLVIYSKEEEHDIEKLSEESSSNFFYTASFCATAVFEGLGAQGSNILMKSGRTLDNLDGRLCIHVLPRFQNDDIDILLDKMTEKPDIDDVTKNIRDYIFEVEYHQKERQNSVDDNIDDDEVVVEAEYEGQASTNPYSDEIKNAINEINK